MIKLVLLIAVQRGIKDDLPLLMQNMYAKRFKGLISTCIENNKKCSKRTHTPITKA